jgi:diacylglycerol kinase (ATP)
MISPSTGERPQPLTPEMQALEMMHRTAHHGETYSHWFILNPVAGRGKAKKQLKWLQDALTAKLANAAIQLTEKKGDAIAFTPHAMAQVGVVVACGGDGTVSEVAQHLVGTTKVLGVLPLGSGNDFFKNLSRKKNLVDAFHALLDAELHTHDDSDSNAFITRVDVGKVVFTSNGVSMTRHFLNSAGLGFTGQIAAFAAQSRFAGDLIYFDALLRVFKTYRASPLTLTLDGETHHETTFALTLGNGKVEGGKFKIAPTAHISDGKLDVSLLKDFPRHQLPKWVLKFLRGSHTTHPNVIYRQAKTLRVDLSQETTLHLDGEVFENVSGTLTVSCLPKALRVVKLPV